MTENNRPVKLPIYGFMTADDLSELFRVQKQTIRRWIREGLFPPGMKAPGGRRWSREIVEAYLQKGQASRKTMQAILDKVSADKAA